MLEYNSLPEFLFHGGPQVGDGTGELWRKEGHEEGD